MNDLPTELVPRFRTDRPNETVKVIADRMSLIRDDEVLLSGDGEIEMCWLPSPGVRFSIKRKSEYPHEFFKYLGDPIPQGCKIVLESSGKRLPVFVTSHSFPEGFRMYHGRVQDDAIPSTFEIKEATFHLANFKAVLCEAVAYQQGGGSRLGRFRLEADGWTIIVDDIQNGGRHGDLEKQLDAQGGYAITHVGRIARADGGAFTGDQCTVLHDRLFWFFSFCRCCKTGPILVGLTGKNENENRLSLVERSVSSWQYRSSWVPETEFQVLPLLFPGFLKRINEPSWSDTIAYAIHWYLEVHDQSGAIQGAIVFGQTALEMLGWSLLVDDLRNISREGYDKLPASDKIRLLLTTVGVPREIPLSFTRLLQAAKAENWQDGPDAVSGIRNRIVHSSADKRKALSRVEFSAICEAWELCLWYNELTLLRLFDYSGQYFDRTRSAKYRSEGHAPVPWAANGQVGKPL
ncbi:MAG: hypothetical protein ABSA12_00155 [Verrucomicrobiia bacterium]